MNVIIQHYKKAIRKNSIKKAVKALNMIQNYFYFEIEEAETEICVENLVNWESIYRHKVFQENEHVIFITEKPFDDNWFSHEDIHYSVITTNGWEEKFSPPSLRVYLIFQIAQSVMNFELERNEPAIVRFSHEDTKGCMFDFCKKKRDIKLAMVSGNICPTCKSNLIGSDVSVTAINEVSKILEYVRGETTGNLNDIKDAAFVIMKFSINDENANAYKYGICEALDKLGIEYYRADNNLNSGPMLEKILGDIEKCRHIIAVAPLSA